MRFADQDNVHRVTRAINGGLIGLSDRMEWLRLTKAVWL
jgi:predicted chitinase